MNQIKKNKIYFFTKYSQKGPSSRYRSYQYKSILNKHFCIKYYPLFDDNYIINLYEKNKINYFKVFFAYFFRILNVLKYLGTKNIIFIEYELLPYFPPILEYFLYKTNVKFILDYDDAIFHNYDLHSNSIIRLFYKNKIPTIVKYSEMTITGSPYLTIFLNRYTNNIIEIPTSINFDTYFTNNQVYFKKDSLIVGWIGSKSTSINILSIKEVIIKLSIINPKIVFKLMGFDNNLKSKLDYSNVQFYDWSEKEELNFLIDIDLGIMPLYNTPSNQGKCGFKLIQYMAMGKPTLSSPLLANVKINRDNSNLFATNEDEWINSIIDVSSNLSYYQGVGLRNQEIVKKYYSVEENSYKYINIIKQLYNVRD
jgi:hypothetical protein